MGVVVNVQLATTLALTAIVNVDVDATAGRDTTRQAIAIMILVATGNLLCLVWAPSGELWRGPVVPPGTAKDREGVGHESVMSLEHLAFLRMPSIGEHKLARRCESGRDAFA